MTGKLSTFTHDLNPWHTRLHEDLPCIQRINAAYFTGSPEEVALGDR